MKVVFINYEPLLLKTEQTFYLGYLKDNGIDLEYWDISEIYFKDLKIPGTVERSYVRAVNSMKELEHLIDKEDIQSTIYILQVAYEMRVFGLYRMLTKKRCRTCYFYVGLHAMKGGGSSFASRISRVLNMLNPDNLKRFLSYKAAQLLKRHGLVKDYNFVFCGGQEAIDTYKRYSKIIPIHFQDYDEYLAIRNKTTSFTGHAKYCVFLDIYFPYHIDLEMMKIKTIDPERYYGSLNSFFDSIEKQCGLKVIIAAHPKSDYDEKTFHGREVYKYKTNELVKDCEFAIMHFSASISYPVLHKKPILFIYTDDIRNVYNGKQAPNYQALIHNLADILDANLLNIDDIERPGGIRVNEVSRVRYDEYKYKYLVSKENEGRPSNEIVLDYFKMLEKGAER